VSFERTAARLGLAGLAVIAVFLLLQLGVKADHAVANRSVAAAPRTPAEAVWRSGLSFDSSTRPAGLLVRGWFAPELGSGVWSSGKDAVLKVPASLLPGPSNVALAVEPFVAPTVPVQRVRVRAGARVLGEWRLTRAGMTSLDVQIPAELRGPAGDVDLQLELPDAAPPKGHVEGSQDVRVLAIKLRRMDLYG
jgi:hypothetical protein